MKSMFRIPSLIMMAVLFVFSTATAQKVKTKGDLDVLKGQKQVNVQYDYSSMSVGDFEKEEDYLEDRAEKRNDEEAGTGDDWREKWVGDRKERFEPKFEELLNENLDGRLKAGNYPDAKYTLILKTTHTEPGFNVGVWRKSAHINANIELVETSNQTKPIATVSMEKVPGRDAFGYDFDTGYRLQEAYAKAGKELGQLLKKKALK